MDITKELNEYFSNENNTKKIYKSAFITNQIGIKIWNSNFIKLEKIEATENKELSVNKIDFSNIEYSFIDNTDLHFNNCNNIDFDVIDKNENVSFSDTIITNHNDTLALDGNNSNVHILYSDFSYYTDNKENILENIVLYNYSNDFSLWYNYNVQDYIDRYHFDLDEDNEDYDYEMNEIEGEFNSEVFSNLELDNLKISSCSGKITLHANTLNNIELSTFSGSLELKLNELKYLEKLDLDNINCKNMAIIIYSSFSGSLSFNNFKADNIVLKIVRKRLYNTVFDLSTISIKNKCVFELNFEDTLIKISDNSSNTVINIENLSIKNCILDLSNSNTDVIFKRGFITGNLKVISNNFTGKLKFIKCNGNVPENIN